VGSLASKKIGLMVMEAMAAKTGYSRTLRLKDKKLETRVVAEVDADAISWDEEAGAAMGVNEQHGMSRDPLLTSYFM
jgi:hypothetical protein